MNNFLEKSIELVNNHDYLDRLFTVYPTSLNVRRNIDSTLLTDLKSIYNSKNNKKLIQKSLELKLFPLKDSYVAFLRRVPNAIERNPQTVNRLAGAMYELGWDKLLENITEPKESNRQMGGKFQTWVKKNTLGLMPVNKKIFLSNKDNAILDASDDSAKKLAEELCGYSRDKGLDFMARFNGKYIIGEAKFLTDFGGHQNAQLEDALITLKTEVKENTIVVAILDGVLYTEKNKMYNLITNDMHKDYPILSALLLRDFCYSV